MADLNLLLEDKCSNLNNLTIDNFEILKKLRRKMTLILLNFYAFVKTNFSCLKTTSQPGVVLFLKVLKNFKLI